jgi:hypothetical protein
MESLPMPCHTEKGKEIVKVSLFADCGREKVQKRNRQACVLVK